MKKLPDFRSKLPLLSGLALSIALVGCGSSDDSLETKVSNDLGTFEGIEENGHVAFKGIRYAAAPEGDLRFKAPTAAPSLEGTFDASTFGSACPQAGGTFGVSSLDEDCLFLNVFTPDVEGEHPVMVWIHGGAFVTGAGSEYDPTELVNEGITVVTINYRLGALGFLSHPELTTEAGSGSGNYGLMDQQFALQWVQDNIASFGGNPENVTIFGESAGGHSVTSQIVAAADYDGTLFHKAIIQSGNYHLEQLNQGSAEYIGSAVYGATLGCASTESENLTCLRSKTVKDILTAQTQDQYLPSSGSYSISSLTISNSFLPTPVETAIASGDFENVSIINGTNLNEGTLFTALDQLAAMEDALPEGVTLEDATQEQLFAAYLVSTSFISTEEQYLTSVNELFALFPHLLNGHTVQEVADTYADAFTTTSGETTTVDYYKALSKMHTDWRFACTASKTNIELAEHTTVYSYHFTDTGAPNILGDFNPNYLGATHASEIQYIFNDGNSEFSSEQEALSAAMIDYWASFAKTGTPSSHSVTWSAFDGTSSAAVIDLNPTLALSTKAEFDTTHNCSFWNTTASEEL